MAALGLAERAIGVGAIAPEFSLGDSHGQRLTLSALLVHGPVVLSFYRGGWCPYCNLELRALQARLAEFTAAGAMLVAISPQAPDASLSTQEKAQLTFLVLSDPGSEVARTYGLVYTVDSQMQDVFRGLGNDLREVNGSDVWELPIPATYVIGADGTVAYAYVDPDYPSARRSGRCLGRSTGAGRPVANVPRVEIVALRSARTRLRIALKHWRPQGLSFLVAFSDRIRHHSNSRRRTCRTASLQRTARYRPLLLVLCGRDSSALGCSLALSDTSRTVLWTLSRWRHGFESHLGCKAF